MNIKSETIDAIIGDLVYNIICYNDDMTKGLGKMVDTFYGRIIGIKSCLEHLGITVVIYDGSDTYHNTISCVIANGVTYDFNKEV